MRKRETTWKWWRDLFLGCCVGIGFGSLLFLVSCQSEEDSSNPQTAGTFSPTKPIGSTTLSHGGPLQTNQSLNGSIQGFTIGQRVLVRGPMDRAELSVPLLSRLPGTSEFQSSQTENPKHALLTGTMVTVLEIHADSVSGGGSLRKGSGKGPTVYYKVKGDNGVQGWVSSHFLVRQNIQQGEK